MRRTLFSFSIVAVLVGVFLVASPAKADFLQDVANGIINGISYILIEIAAIFIQLTIFALKFFIEIAGYNNFIDADIVKLGWNMVRDVANMFFVVVLLVIAFGTILGLDQYEWKKTLIKLILSAFLVNFSNLICQVIIDAAQVFTITFLNAIAGAAGGNLIKMFNLDEVYNIATNNTDPNGLQIQLFGGAVMTIIFAGTAMITIGAYLIVIIVRMVVLWTLMILSPLAFLFSALPNTQSYAKEFWDQFINHVIVAPVMVFFLWLAFATFGGGNVVQNNIEQNHPLIIDGGIQPITQATDGNGNSLGVSYSQAASWENMANFAVAIAFLWIGIERVQKLGVYGGGIVSAATSFGKNVATIASGYAVGRWLVGKGKSATGAVLKGVGKGAYEGLLANRVEIVKNWGLRQAEGWRDFRAEGPRKKMKEVWKKGDLDKDKSTWTKTATEGQFLDKQNRLVDSEGRLVGENGKLIQERNKTDRDIALGREGTGKPRWELYKNAEGKTEFEDVDSRSAFQKFFYKRNQAVIQSRKRLEKVKRERATRDELIDKRVTAEPKYFMQRFEGKQTDALDRVIQGELEEEKARSAAKTAEFSAIGRQVVSDSARFKDNKFQDKAQKGTVAEQKVAYKEQASRTEQLIKESESRARRNFVDSSKGRKVVEGRIKAEVEVKALDAESKRTEAIVKTGVMRNSSDVIERAIAADKQAHSEGIKQELDEKILESAYLKSEAGQAELREEAGKKIQLEDQKKAIEQMEAEAGRDVANEFKHIFENINLSEQATKAAQDFVKEIKAEDLKKKFGAAAEEMKKWLDLGSDDLRKRIDEAKVGQHGAYIAALGQSQALKMMEEGASLRTKQAQDAAEDAFIHRPRYGTTSSSTVYSDYSESKMKDYRRLERAAAMKKATDTLAFLMHRKDQGDTLDIDQTAEMAAASSFLQEEAWNDDQAEYIFQMFKNLRDGKIKNPDEAAQWKTMAKHFSKLGWIDSAVVQDDGSIAPGADIKGSYNRKNAADLQNLAITGGDVELVRAHNLVSAKLDTNAEEVRAAAETARATVVDKAIASGSYNAQMESALPDIEVKVNLEAEKLELADDKKEEFVQQRIIEEQRKIVEEAAKKEVQEAVLKAVNATKKDYWEIADQELKTAGISGIGNKQQLKARYETHFDLLQDATKTYKANALNTGHEELGQNQDFDETENVYRFQSKREGQAKVRADRVKMKTRQLINADQYHSNGTLDFDTGIIDDFVEDVISLSLGKAQKAIDLTDIPERSLKGHAYIHKNEDAKTVRAEKLRGVKTVAVIGGDAAFKKFEREGERDIGQKTDHMLTRGILAQLMSGDRGWALGLSKLYKHTNEKQAQEGIINIKVGEEEFKTTGDLARHLLNKMKDKNYLKNSSYRGQESRVREKLNEIVRTAGQAIGGPTRDEDQEPPT